MLSWFTSMPISQNQDKGCCRDWINPWGVFRMIMIAQGWEQDIFLQKRGLAYYVFGRRQVFPRDQFPVVFTLTYFSSSSTNNQETVQQHSHVHRRSSRCTRMCTHGDAPMHPHWWQGWPFPLKCWRCLLQKDVASLKCLSLLLQKEIRWDHTAFISPETTAGIQSLRDSLNCWTIWAICPEPWFSSTMCGWTPWRRPLFFPTLMQRPRRKVYPLLLWHFETFQWLVSEKLKYHKQILLRSFQLKFLTDSRCFGKVPI